jgi:Mrp family chromosome partitioning ATPase
MSSEPAENPLSERIARAFALARRGRRYLLGALLVFAIGCAATFLMTLKVRRAFMSECTFAVRSAEKPGQDHGETALKRAARVKDMVYERARLEGAIRKFNLYPGVVDNSGMVDAVEAMKPHVGIRARESGRYVVSFDMAEIEGTDTRNLVRDVTQYLAESITEDFVGGSIAELKSDASFLSKEVDTASGEIDTAVKAVTRFLALHPEFAVDLPAGTSIGISNVAKKPTGAEPVSTDPVLAALLRQKARLEADLRVTSKPATAPSAPASSETRDHAVAAVDAAAKAYAVAQADVVAKSAKLTAEHPDMKSALATAASAAANLQDARAKLAAIDAASATAPSAEAGVPAESQSDKLKLVNAQIAAREAALKAAPTVDPAAPTPSPVLDLETEWQRTLRALGEARKRYDEVKSKSEATALALKASEANKSSLVAIIEPAYRPTKPTKGRRAMTAMLGLASSFAFALLYVLGRILLEDHLTDAGDIEALGLATTLGTLANVSAKNKAQPTEDALAKQPPSATALGPLRRPVDHPAFEGRPLRAEAVMPSPTSPAILAVLGDDPKPIAALRLVRHRLELLHGDGKRTFAVTSPREGEGKSTFAAQLALVLSESQRAQVALVDANFHKPSLARILGFSVPEGLGLSAQVMRAMRGKEEPWSMLALGPSFHVLAEAEDQPRFPRALHSAVFQDLLALLSEAYDYVIVDGPCVLEGGEANALEPAVDGMIFVTRAGVSKKSELRMALRQLGTRKNVGVVLIDAPPGS